MPPTIDIVREYIARCLEFYQKSPPQDAYDVGQFDAVFDLAELVLKEDMKAEPYASAVRLRKTLGDTWC